MNIDGEWRTAFIADEAPDLPYGTAPVPVDDDNPDLYGGGYTTGNIIGIPKRAEHQEQGWALLKYLATDDKAQVMLSNGLRNVPTTESSAKSPDLKPDPKFETFVKIFAQPEHDDDAGDRRRQRLPGAVQQLRQQVAGRAGRRPPGRPRTTSTSRSTPSSRTPRANRCRERGAATATLEAGPVAPSPDGPGVHEPVDRRLQRVLRLSAGRRRSTCRSPTTTCSSRRAGSGSPTTSTCSRRTSRSGRRSTTRSGWSRSWCR